MGPRISFWYESEYIYFSCLLKAFYVFLFILPSFHPLCFPDTCSFICLLLLLSLAFHRQTTNCILLSAAPSDIHVQCPHALMLMRPQTISHIQWLLMFFCLSFLMHLALFFICVCISSFYVLLTAEWHRQVSWLGQFGWYNCYYQHPTFRRIPGSRTNLSNLMLKWNQAL